MAKEKELTIRLSNAAEELVSELVRRGIYPSRSRAIEVGIFKLGLDHGLVKPSTRYWGELRKAERKLTLRDVLEALEEIEGGP